MPRFSDQVLARINEIEDELAIPCLTREEAGGLIETIGQEIDEAYYKAVLAIQLDPGSDKSNLRVVFSPQHGTSNVPVRAVMHRLGYDLVPVEEQSFPDPDFRNTKNPNPEERVAFDLALVKARECGADLIITTDPDADRLGIAVRHGGDYVFLTGNQTGAVLLEYILSQRKAQGTLPKDGIVINTIVTSDLGDRVARAYGMATEKTLTGFKFIGDRIRAHEQAGDHTYVFGYEESYGYLISPIARDKDAIQAVLMICEAANFYKRQGKTLKDALDHVFTAYGYSIESLLSLALEGAEGSARIAQIMHDLRTNPPKTLAGSAVAAVEDYELGVRHTAKGEEPLTLPKSDVLKFLLEDGSWAAVRPSGTEPKCKYYFCARGDTMEQATERMEAMRAHFQQ